MRCYDGCPDAEMQASIDRSLALSDKLHKIGCKAVWFPVEEKWMVFYGIYPITDFHNTKQSAVDAIFRRLS